MDVDNRRVYADFYSYALALFNLRSDGSQGNRQSETLLSVAVPTAVGFVLCTLFNLTVKLVLHFA